MNKPSFAAEQLYWQHSTDYVVGFDEAGRGCLAGPVSAAAFVWPKMTDESLVPDGIRDSKTLTEQKREALLEPAIAASPWHAQAYASSKEIDRWNILQATCLAMARALETVLGQIVAQDGKAALRANRFAFLIDGKLSLMTRVQSIVNNSELMNEFPLTIDLLKNGFRETCIVKGDQKSYSIAAASILAKVLRDRRMRELSEDFPEYDFNLHKGYSTAAHKSLLLEHGPCEEHRFSFAPVKLASQSPR